MRAGIRPTDTIARLGGDEFAILFEGLADAAVDRVLEVDRASRAARSRWV